MKQSAIIKDVKLGLDNNGREYFECFLVLRDGDKRTVYVDPTSEISGLDVMTNGEVIEWAKGCLGRRLFYSDLEVLVYCVVGKTYIV